MDHQGAKPAWNLTVWALAGFFLLAAALHVGGATSTKEVAAATGDSTS